MKLLCFGGAGFLGSWVCQLFREKGWTVTAYDSLTKFELLRTGYNVNNARQYNVDFLKSIGVELIVDDIRNAKEVFAAMRGCDYVINCAAQPAMTVALENPVYDAEVNIMGTLNILNAAKILKIPAAICSTIHVYGNGINDELVSNDFVKVMDVIKIKKGEYPLGYDKIIPQFKEDRFFRTPASIDEEYTILSGQITPLHVSKYTTEIAARAFTESYNCKVFTARLTGIYGPRQLGGEDHGWVANFAIKTLLGLPISVFGTDKQVRDILYVKDAAQAFLDWYEHWQKSGVYNIGGGIPCITSIKTCLQKLSDITMMKQDITMAPARPGDLWYFCCDTTKARETFGWKPTVLPDEGLVRLVYWIKGNEGLFKA